MLLFLVPGAAVLIGRSPGPPPGPKSFSQKIPRKEIRADAQTAAHLGISFEDFFFPDILEAEIREALDALATRMGELDLRWAQAPSDVRDVPGILEELARAHRLLERNPRDPAGHTSLARIYTRINQLDTALRHARLAQEIEPDQSIHRLHVGMILAQQSSYDEALKELRTVVTDPVGRRMEDAWRTIGTTCYALSRTDEAADAFRKAVEANPQNPESRLGLGRAHLDQNRLDESIRELARAAELDPSRAEAHALLGLAQLRAGRTNEAEKTLRRALSKDTHNLMARYNLAQALLLSGRQAEVERELAEFRRIQAAGQKAEENLYRLATTFQTGIERIRHQDVAEGEQLLLQVLIVQPYYSPALYALGHTYMKLLRLDDAASCFERVLSLDPLNAGARHYLANLLLRRGRVHEALEAAALACLIYPDDPGFQVQHASALLRAGRTREARRSLKSALIHDPGNEAANLELGIAALLDKNVEEATEALERAAEASPDDKWAHRLLGLAFARAGRYPQSVERYRRVLESGSSGGRIRLALAEGLLRTGQLAAAEAALKDLIRVDPAASAGHYNLGQLYYAQKRWQEALNALRQVDAAFPRQELLAGRIRELTRRIP